MNTTDVMPVNSRSWWEDYFDQSWDVYDGRGQTAYFMRLLVENLPSAERGCLLAQEASILDWGCAFGEGVDALSRAFPRCRAVGMDFAQRAIAEARQSFPQLDFRHTEEGEINDQFDVVVTSNCLEHFSDPLSVMRRHLRSCREFYAILVPYREEPLHPSHVQQFGEEFFPEILEGFVRLTTVVINCGSPYWPGRQLLVIYGAPSYIHRRLDYALGPLQRQLDKTRAEAARQAAELAAQRRQLQELSALAAGCRAQLDAITRSKLWRSLQALRAARLRLLPPGGRREAAARRLWRAAGRLRYPLPRRWPRFGNQPQAGAKAGPRAGIQDVVAAAKATKGAVIFLPSIPWSTNLFQRPQHLARFFAREGYTVIYDCACGGPVLDVDRGFRPIEPNLYLFRGQRKLLGQLPAATLWCLPYNFGAKDGYPAAFETVYDWIDALEIFYHHGRKLVHRNHQRAMREATVVAAVTRTLQAEALPVRPDALYLPNAVDYAHFADAAAAVPDDPAIEQLRRQGKPVAGYYGALAPWFDYPLLAELARRRPDWNFLLIGPRYGPRPDGELPCCSGLPNVTWIGPRDYGTLPGYLRLFDVAMIPFQLNDITRATSPLKLYEFFAAGKPVVSTPLPECVAHGEVHVAGTVEEFAAALDAAREESRDAARCEQLRAIGRSNSWQSRVQAAAEALDRRRAELQPSGESTP